jgi:hypothetical protein
VERRVRENRDSLRRRSAQRHAKLRLLIVTEGQLTEPRYFQALQHAFKNRMVHIEVQGKGAVPSTLVTAAIELRDKSRNDASKHNDSNLRFDETWVVCDVDAHHGLNDALALAKSNEIQVALSDPCLSFGICFIVRPLTPNGIGRSYNATFENLSATRAKSVHSKNCIINLTMTTQ